jgi:hypothetical protein
VFHFARQSEIKFRPKVAGHVSDDCFEYSPDNPKSTSGSGLLAAAHVLGRVGCGCEISPAYCDVILGRISKLAGEEPVLEATGQTIAEVAAERGIQDLRKAS